MRHPQLLVCESDGRLTGLLKEFAHARKWFFRTRRQPASCLRLLLRGSPTVLVVAVGHHLKDRSLEGEFGLLEQVSGLFSDTAVIAVIAPEAEALAELAWALGARYVLLDGQANDQLPDLVAGLMKLAVKRSGSGS